MSRSYKHNYYSCDYNKGMNKLSNRITRRKINSGKYDDLLFFEKSNKYRQLFLSYNIHDYKFRYDKTFCYGNEKVEVEDRYTNNDKYFKWYYRK